MATHKEIPHKHVNMPSNAPSDLSSSDKKDEHKAEEHALHAETSPEEKADAQAAEEQQKKSSRLLLFTVLFILFLIAGFVSLRYYYHPAVNSKDTYNGFSCHTAGNYTYCQVYIQKSVPTQNGSKELTVAKIYNLEFWNSPWKVEDIPLYGNVSQLVNKTNTKFVYLAIPGDINGTDLAMAGISAIEISRMIGDRYDIYNIPAKSALITESVYYNTTIPVVSCSDAVNGTAVILFGYGSENIVLKQGDCYIVSGITGTDIIRAADRLSYTVLGIMPEGPIVNPQKK